MLENGRILIVKKVSISLKSHMRPSDALDKIFVRSLVNDCLLSGKLRFLHSQCPFRSSDIRLQKAEKNTLNLMPH